MNLLLMSLYGGILIGVTLLLRALFKNRLPRITFLILWGIALLRLLIPFSIPARFSIYSLIGQQEMLEYRHMENVDQNLEEYSLDIHFHDLDGLNPDSDINVGTVITVIRWGGTLFWTLLFCTLYFICLRRFHCSLPIDNEYVQQWLSLHQLRRPVTVRQSDRVPTPLIYGLFRPVILLPEELMHLKEEKMEYILQHEYQHICRFDEIWKFLMVLAVCLHWFNPMVWIMYYILSRDIELACDESVLTYFGAAAKKPYAQILLEMSEEKPLFKPLFNAFGRNATEERIRAIMKYKKKTFVTIVISATLITMVACGFATSKQPDGEVPEVINSLENNEVNDSSMANSSSEAGDKDRNITDSVLKVGDREMGGADTAIESTEVQEWISLDIDGVQGWISSDMLSGTQQKITIYIPKEKADNIPDWIPEEQILEIRFPEE